MKNIKILNLIEMNNKVELKYNIFYIFFILKNKYILE